MRLPMGGLIAALLLAGAAAPVAAPVWAAWPERPVHWVVPYTPGGATDIVARIIGAKLSIAFGQVVIDNRPGAGGNVGTDIVAKSPPDGYTMLFAGVAHAISETAYPVLPFDLHRDLASSSSRSPRRSPASSISPRAATAPRCICPASCSSSWPASTWRTCPIAAPRRRSRT